MHDYISGIQQIGIGVTNAERCVHEYAALFGMDTLVFNDVSDAKLMSCYTGGQVYQRQAFLSLNLQGGGGLEIWQFKNRIPRQPIAKPLYGDIGIYAAKLKSHDVVNAHKQLCTSGLNVSSIRKDENGNEHFYIKDKHYNLFNIVTSKDWFQHHKKLIGGVTGAVIGVSDMDAAICFYSLLLNTDRIVYDYTGTATNGFEVDESMYRKVLLRKEPNGKGAFGKLLGSVEIELVQCLDRAPLKIYENRFWGDCGFIHLCFDVFNMTELKKHAEQHGYMFTIDSVNSFDMENTSGRFCYVEDPDGTLIELVETHKIPIIKSLGLYLDLKRRNLEKPLPDWIIKLLAFNKVK